LRLAALVESPDAFGRTLSEERSRSDAAWIERFQPDSGSDLPLVAELNGEPIGLAWGRIPPESPDTAFVFQMWVAPEHRRRAAGWLLLEAIIEWARSQKALRVKLGVTCGDSPATRLYSRAGFEPVGEPERLREDCDLLAQCLVLDLQADVS
jgi:GNAT superfamily N-acetyltransferase